jgi:DNA mismatch repair protein MutS2
MLSGKYAQLYCPFEPGYLENQLAVLPHLTAGQLIELKNWFIFIHSIKKEFKTSGISIYFNKLGNYHNIVKIIEHKIDDSEQISDNASQELFRIRVQKKKVRSQIKQTLNAILMNRQSIFSDSNIVEREGRFVLPVLRNFKKDISGIIHAYSNTGETVFIEPVEIIDMGARIRELNDLEKEEIERILRGLTDIIRADTGRIEADIDTMIDLDMLFAKVRYAQDLKANMPIFSGNINIMGGYHPILKLLIKDAISLNLKMNGQGNILLVSGPNAGGKTVVLKTVGLLALMAKCGMFIPVGEGSTIPFYDEVYADIGDEQSIEYNLSTFAAHINQIKYALEGSTKSLVLLDELMSQTSVEEGSALAVAILERFAKRGNTVLATTHNEDLKIFVSRREDMMNAGMEFLDRPTYRLILGIPQPSNAIKLAKNLGIDKQVISNAIDHLDKDKMSLNTLFEDLAHELKAIKEEREKLSSLIKEYEVKLGDLNHRKKQEMNSLKEKYRRELITSKRNIEKLIKELKKRPKPEVVHKVREFFEEKLSVDEDIEPYYPESGEIVRIRQLKRTGQVVDEQSGKFKISLDNIFYWVDAKEIERIEEGN